MLTRTSETKQAINLAHVAPFRLGALEIHPATRQLLRDGRSETLEPRVMQVLVALAQAGGAVVTRDELTDLCWDGRIVSENAINRVISRLRQIAAEFAGGVFRIETITKVGYRIVRADGAPALLAFPERSAPFHIAPGLDRRLVLGGALALLGAAAAGSWWLGGQAHRPTPEAAALYRKGLEARNQGWLDLSDQALAYFQQATEADPDFAQAWGALALAYAGRVNRSETALQPGLAERSRAAARRALELDSNQLAAEAAGVLLLPMYRRWAAAEADYRRLLARRADPWLRWLLLQQQGRLLAEVGRLRESLPFVRAAVAANPLHPGANTVLMFNLWAAGRLEEAESLSSRAITRWPKHPGIWFNRMALLTYSGRPEAALALANDTSNVPDVKPEGIVARRVSTAWALATRDPAHADQAAAYHLEDVRRDRGGIPAATRLFAALGRVDEVFALCDAYFFDRGPFTQSPPAQRGPFTYYDTGFLFWPPMARVRGDPRFGRLTEAIGLEAYWRSTGTLPDYRRG